MPTLPRPPTRRYLTALAELHAPDRSREAWHALGADEQAEAVRRMAADGMSDHGIAHATGLAVEQVRAILAEARP